ncbi:type IV pilus assembly protein PilW [Pseudomonas nitritireducens]|uniref:Type IV pilus assembly protein PilW n=1 Tax=Pseudomonas nitroreducens TaxID=46680 RepID=A0A7W7KPR6_PSENT|nr:PilW family protein [Pseudomonas nitritireducens]MBB4866606.1 type IV pilus assembly protein PilW [Pseudomonas nitritireducens]
MACPAQRGLSLVELLIAMALGLVLLAGVLEVVLGSKRTYQASQGLAELQESGRFALDIIAQDLRAAGFAGACPAGLVNASGFSAASFALQHGGIEGYGSGMSEPDWLPSRRLANTDAVLLRYVGEPALAVSSITGNQARLASSAAVVGVPYLLSDLQSCLLLRNDGSATTLAADRPLTHFLAAASRAYRYRYVIYWIGKGEDGTPGLFASDNSANNGLPQSSELVSGVAGMSLRYGVSADAGEAVTAYRAAKEMTAADWRRVRTVRVSLLLQSLTRNVDETPTALLFDGRTLAANAERRLRLVMGSTTALRNAAGGE